MGNWAKVESRKTGLSLLKAVSLLGLVFVLSACGRDSGQDSVQANTAPAKNCWNGQCNWNGANYPGSWQTYQYGTQYYNNYSNGGCGMYGPNFQPYWQAGRGFICVPMANANMFMRNTWAGGYYYQSCDPLYQNQIYYPNGMPNPCPSRCYYNNPWNNSYPQLGVCQ